MTERSTRPSTLGELKNSGERPLSVKIEMQRNLIYKLRHQEPLFPEVSGFDDTVIPQLTNAILGLQDIILLGERGQAKSRLARGLVNLLDEWSPVLAGLDIPEHPMAPITTAGRQLVSEAGDSAPINWLHREERYAEKLATPDITMADLIGEIDPIKIAEGRYLSDELTLHYGLIPRVNRGIFTINELPDLTERIQVGMLNLLEERDIQIRGFKIRLPLDIFIIATANPEDYTNRGRIITPLKDRYGAQIRTHYPTKVDAEVVIMEQEAKIKDFGDYPLRVAPFMKEVVAELTHQARRSPDLNQRSGVSVRASIASYEALIANAFRRALRLGEEEIVPRMSDLPFVVPSFQGKVEFEAMEEGQEDKILQRLLQSSLKAVFSRYYEVDNLESVAFAFADGLTVETGEAAPGSHYLEIVEQIPSLETIFIDADHMSAGEKASVVEFILEGLHANKLLNKRSSAGQNTFSA